MSIEIQGAEELLIKFSKMKDDAAIQKGMQQACALVEASAKEKAPADTGALRRSIASRIEGGGAAIQGIIYAPLPRCEKYSFAYAVRLVFYNKK